MTCLIIPYAFHFKHKHTYVHVDYTRHDTEGGGKGGYGEEAEEEEWGGERRERRGRDGEEVGILLT